MANDRIVVRGARGHNLKSIDEQKTTSKNPRSTVGTVTEDGQLRELAEEIELANATNSANRRAPSLLAGTRCIASVITALVVVS